MGARAAANGRDGTNAKADADAGLATRANGDANAALDGDADADAADDVPADDGTGAQQYYYAPPPPPVAKKSSGSDVPAWMWVGLGVALATVGGKIFGAKKQDMQSMMMQQMMKQFTSQAGGGMPGGMPGMGMPGMPGMPGAGMPGAAGGFPPFPGASATPPVDVKPSPPKPAAPKPATAATPTSSGRGSATTTQPTTAEEPSPAVKSEFAGFADQQTPVVEPTTAPPSSNPFFDDAEDTAPAGAATDDVSEEDLQYMQDMIRNPEMQKLMYPYLPEFMRNPETFEMLLSNPQYKDQLKGIMLQMKAGGMGAPGGMSMPDINSPEVQEQFAQMGMKPEDVLTQIMSDPELAQAFQDPKVQAAVMDCSTNPMNITKYQNDPQIMGVFEKLAALFPQDVSGMGGVQ